MLETSPNLLHVNIPVGFLLTEPRQIELSVDRSSDPPLAIRLCLIPAQSSTGASAAPSRLTLPRPPRRAGGWEDNDDGYWLPDYGGGD